MVGARVAYDVRWSDHSPLSIECDISGVATAPAVSCKPDALKYVRWGERTTSQINKYGEFCFNNLDVFTELNICDCKDIIKCTHQSNYHDYIDRYYRHIVDVLQNAAIVSSRSCAQKRHKKVAGWNYHVRDSHEKARLYFRCWVVAGRPSCGPEYENMRNSRTVFKNKIRWCQRNEESIKMNILALHRRNKNFTKFWNATKKLNCKQSLPVSVEGLQDYSAIAELFASRFKVNPLPAKCVRTIEPCLNDEVTEFTRRDISKVIMSMKRGKSPGHDGLSIEHILWASDKINYHLCYFFNLCLKYS